MAENPASIADLISRSLRTLTDQEQSVGATLLDDAWTAILSRIPSVATRLDLLPADDTFLNLVIQIECAMVLRVLNNPDGKLEETGDDYSYRRDSAVSTGVLYLSDVEAGLLSATGGSVGAFTIRPVGRTPDYNYITGSFLF